MLWYKAHSDDLYCYTSELQERLLNLQVPRSLSCNNVHCNDSLHSQQRDEFVIDIMSHVIETTYDCIPLNNLTKTKQSPKKHCPLEKNIPGWQENVEPYRKDAVFWHSVWQSAGRPTTGQLRDIMARTRNLYHYSVRRTKTVANSIRARKLFEASCTSLVDLLTEMRKIKGKKVTPTVSQNVWKMLVVKLK